jgi:N-acetylmuramoyl-L-alanine amidase
MKRVLLSVALAGLAACGGPPPPAEVEAPDTLYRQLEDPLPRVDRTLLAGCRILIDPGHGGSFRGTMGPDSLEEKKVNLGVSLYLWGLLREAGAEAALTRTMDRDFLSEADSSLTADLQTRVDMADSLKPDIFISIHHNAQPARDPAFNRIETYYKAGDPASLDLATAVHRHLMRNIGIDVGEVRQGNYYVLRNMEVPAILGESSYLTHPPVEEKLRLSRAQELEAEAYFLGIVDYCRRGLPRVTSVAPAESILTSVPVIAAALEDRFGIGMDPDGVSLLLNGELVDARLSADGKRVVYPLPWDAPNGDYDVRVSARNLRGNTSPVARAPVRLDPPPALAAIAPAPARVVGRHGARASAHPRSPGPSGGGRQHGHDDEHRERCRDAHRGGARRRRRFRAGCASGSKEVRARRTRVRRRALPARHRRGRRRHEGMEIGGGPRRGHGRSHHRRHGHARGFRGGLGVTVGHVRLRRHQRGSRDLGAGIPVWPRSPAPTRCR